MVCAWSNRLSYHHVRPNALWRMDGEKSGGIVLEWEVHEIDFVCSIGGVVTDETPTSITVRNQVEAQTIPRTDIASITASATSAMPPGLEAQIDEQQMADLLAFLKRE